MFIRTIRIVALLLCALFTFSAAAQEGEYALTLMHTNDTRATHLPDANGVGGAARQATVVRQIRAETENSLLLDAGGRFTGTLFHRVYAGQDNVQVMNALGYDAMTIGNPEFDNGDVILAQFIDGLNFPVLVANVDTSRSEALNGRFVPSTVLEAGGRRIGLIGITTDSTPRLSSPGRDLIFQSNMRALVQAQADALTADGVNIIILLSYLGYENDLALAAELRGVDVIVGGNSRTLLSNTQPDAAGPYPAEVTAADGGLTLVVQSGGGARGELRFMGRLDLAFDDEGAITAYSGDTILLDASIPPDPDVEALIADLDEQVQLERGRVIRSTAGTPVEVLTAWTVEDCRIRECALGNLVADALRWRTGTDVALMNGGGLRGGLEAGTLLRGEVLELLPFTNRLSTLLVTGADLLLALENGVSRVGESSGTGRFPQVSGMRYTYDPAQPALSRIVALEILNSDGVTYAPVDPTRRYSLTTNDFIRRGGDGYQVFADRGIDPVDTVIFFDDVLLDYAREFAPLDPQLEGRISVVGE
jgi:5'-nucleotidase